MTAAGVVRAAGGLALRLPRAFWVLVAVGWVAWIWLLSEQEAPVETGTFLWSWIGNTAHAVLYGLLALWLALALPRRPGPTPRGWADLTPRRVTGLILVVGALGALDEWHQSWVAGRTTSLGDVATDLVGAAVVLWVAVGAGRADDEVMGAPVGVRLGAGLLISLGAGLVATLVAGVI